MEFSVLYPQTAFVSIGANKIALRMLEKSVIADAAIVTALDRIRVDNPGTGSTPEVDDPTGRTWSFIFVGAGPLSSPETTALNSIVAAHTGVEVFDPSTTSGGTIGQVWSNTTGTAYGWANSVAGGGNVTAPATATVNAVATYADTAGAALLNTPVTIAPSTGNTTGMGTLSAKTVNATVATKQVPVLSLTAGSGGIDGFLDVQVSSGNPQGLVTGNDKTLLLGSGDISVGGGISPVVYLKNSVGSAGDGPWQPIVAGRPVLTNAINGGAITWLTTATFQVSTGHAVLSDVSGRAKVCSWGATTVNTATAGALGLDTGAVALKKWYYVYAIAKHTTGATGQDVSILMSLSTGIPTLPAGYTFYRRIGVVRTTNSAALLVQMFQVGTGNVREYFLNSTAEMAALTNGASTSQVALGNGDATGLSLPATARNVSLQITTNSSSVCRLRSNASITVTTMEVPISVTKWNLGLTCTAGTYYYINPSVSGSTTITHTSFTEDV